MTEAPAFFSEFLLFLLQIITLKEFVNLSRGKNLILGGGNLWN